LPFLSQQNFVDNVVPGWSEEFSDWAGEALRRGDVETLASFHHAPGMPYAHPTVEHFVPLFITLGAGGSPEQPVRTVVDGFQFGLSKMSIQTESTPGATV
jgi:4,5-DOPA dioxygenase extradiol